MAKKHSTQPSQRMTTEQRASICYALRVIEWALHMIECAIAQIRQAVGGRQGQ